eukprot:7773456-Pyramimonas_sp.AAC.1
MIWLFPFCFTGPPVPITTRWCSRHPFRPFRTSAVYIPFPLTGLARDVGIFPSALHDWPMRSQELGARRDRQTGGRSYGQVAERRRAVRNGIAGHRRADDEVCEFIDTSAATSAGCAIRRLRRNRPPSRIGARTGFEP